MCGDLEEADEDTTRLYGAFRHAAQRMTAELTAKGASRASLHTPDGEIPNRALYAYMDGLFAETLQACLDDAGQVDEAQRARVLSSQAVVMARLAGFLAGHLDLREDPMRMASSALLSGYDAANEG
jgi:hypothetical protein